MTSAAFLLALALGASGSSGIYDAAWAASLPPNSEVSLPAGTYAGPWKLAAGVHLTAALGAVLTGRPGSDATLDLKGDARIEGLTIEAPAGAYGVRAGNGKAELLNVTIRAEPGAKAGIYVSAGELGAHGVSIVGEADYGVLSSRAQRVTVTDATIHSRRGGVAVVSGPAVVEGCVLTGPFADSAISLLDVPEGKLTRNRLEAVKTMGIKLLGGTATLSENRVSGARADPDGLEGMSFYGQGSHVTMTGDQFGDSQSPSQGPVVMLLSSAVRMERVKVRGAVEALLYVAGGTVLKSVGSELRDAPVGITLESGSTASEGGFRFVNVTHPILPIKK